MTSLALRPTFTTAPVDRSEPPRTLEAWSSHLLDRWQLVTTPASHLVPLHLVAVRPDGLVLAFTGVATTLRLALHPAGSMRRVTLRADCDCGEDHGGPLGSRLELDPGAEVLWEHEVDGRAAHGWALIEAASMRAPEASAYLDRLLVRHHEALARCARSASAPRERRRATHAPSSLHALSA